MGDLVVWRRRELARAVNAVGDLPRCPRSFDEQLQVFERIVGPMAEWVDTWAHREGNVIPYRGATAVAEDD